MQKFEPAQPAAAAANQNGCMSDFEITVLVLSEHENFRRKFAALNDADDAEELAAA